MLLPMFPTCGPDNRGPPTHGQAKMLSQAFPVGPSYSSEIRIEPINGYYILILLQLGGVVGLSMSTPKHLGSLSESG